MESFKDFGGRELVSPISISFVGSGHLFLDFGLWTDCAALKAAGLYAVYYDTVKTSALMDSALQCSVVQCHTKLCCTVQGSTIMFSLV